MLIAWQYFYNVPQMEKQRVEAQRQAELQKPAQATPGAAPGTGAPGSATPQAGTTPSGTPAAPVAGVVMPRDAAIAATPRIKIDSFETRVVGDEIQVRIP